MTENNLRDQLIRWIGSELDDLSERKRALSVPVHILGVRLALDKAGDAVSLTQSTKLALHLFDRAALFRTLHGMYEDGLLAFVDENGEAVEPEERELSRFKGGESEKLKSVALTDWGEERYEKLRTDGEPDA